MPAARLVVADDAASGAALVAASPAGAAGGLQGPSASAAGAGGFATPAARLVMADDAASGAALVAAPPAGAAGQPLRLSAAAAGADSAALSRRAAGATAQTGKALAFRSFAMAAGGSGGRPAGELLTWAMSAAGSLAGAAAGAVLGVAAAGAAATSAATAAEARGACSRYAAGCQGHVLSMHRVACACCCALFRQRSTNTGRQCSQCKLACLSNSSCHSSTRLRHTPSASDHDEHGGRTSRDLLYENLMRAAASSSGGRPGCGAGAGTSRQLRPCAFRTARC